MQNTVSQDLVLNVIHTSHYKWFRKVGNYVLALALQYNCGPGNFLSLMASLNLSFIQYFTLY